MNELKETYFEILDFMEEHELSFKDVCTLMEINSRFAIADAIRDCFESNNRLPSVPEAIVMAGNSISNAIKSF